MALRIKTAISALVIFGAAPTFAQPFLYQVRHQHLHGGAMGMLHVTLDSISFDEPGKRQQHSREWKYSEIQQLSLSAASLHHHLSR